MYGARLLKSAHYDIALVGGGLQNGLIALAALRARPRLKLCLIEREPRLGGDRTWHTWCFHSGDVPESMREVVDSITAYRWSGYRVRFPNHERDLDEAYAGTNSDALAAALEAAFESAAGAELRCGVAARAVGPASVELDDGSSVTADLIVDARGPESYVDGADTAAFQKFVGADLTLAAPHGLDRPLLMDATVEQIGGFRFYYILPLAPDRVLVEDTTFGGDPLLETEAMVRGCVDYARAAGLEVDRIARTETGVLAMPWASRAEPPAAPLRAGYQGGWFHPATGYSFPVAARLAGFIAGREPAEVIGPELRALWDAQMRQVKFCHRLNKMLFHWFAEGDEWNVFERFYKLPAPLIRRFYALETTAADRARILIGRPPRGFSLRARLRRRSGS
jgi:lycopene beta-cyclase